MKSFIVVVLLGFLSDAGFAAGPSQEIAKSAAAPLGDFVPLGNYGLRRCALPGLVEAVERSRDGIYACTLGDKTHLADIHGRWGRNSWFNDLYFGLHGGIYVADPKQHAIYLAELRKMARTLHPGKDPVVPFFVSADGASAEFNEKGVDLERSCLFVLNVYRTWEVTGDDTFARELLPACHACLDGMRRSATDIDHIPQGRCLKPNRITGVGSCGGCIYIGDSCRNDWKDFSVTLFYWEALKSTAALEKRFGQAAKAEKLLVEAKDLRESAQRLFWNPESGGYLAWIDKDGERHADWITGSNLHAVADGFATPEQSRVILATLDAHRQEIEEDKPGRVRIGVFADGLCSNPPEKYWNGGAWPLVAAPLLKARAQQGDLAGAARFADRLANRTVVTKYGFYEAYDDKPNECEGLLMNNGGFLWGFFAGVMGVDFADDCLLIRAATTPGMAPAEAVLRWRGHDVEIRWEKSPMPATLDGQPLAAIDGFYRINALPGDKLIKIVIPEDKK
jgi:hypothetical protein